MHSLLLHFFSIGVYPDVGYPLQGGFTIGSENERKDFGNECIELSAFIDIIVFMAVGARLKTMFFRTGSYLAPSGLVVTVAARTAALLKLVTGTTIYTAGGN